MDYTGMIENIASLHNIPNMDKEYLICNEKFYV